MSAHYQSTTERSNEPAAPACQHPRHGRWRVSERPRRVTGAELSRVLERAGWVLVRVTGSHHHYTHPDRPGTLITVPVHAGRTLPIGTQHAIMRDAGLSAEDLRD